MRTHDSWFYGEIQGIDGQPVLGFGGGDCDEVYGDALERTISWKENADIGALAGKPVRLRFAVKDADLYSFQFQNR